MLVPKIMRNYLKKPNRAQERVSGSSWKDHPIVVASIAVATTVTLMGSVVFPLLTAHYSSEVAELRKILDAKREEIDVWKARFEKIGKDREKEKVEFRKLEFEKEQIAGQFRLSIMENPFVLPSGYPKGLDAIRVNSTSNDIELVFQDKKIDKQPVTYWSIEVDHPIFSSVTYYFGNEDWRVTHILFIMRYDGSLKKGDVKTLATRYFGKPRVSVDGNHLWIVGGVGEKERFAVSDEGSLTIYDKSIVPNWLIAASVKCDRHDANLGLELEAFCDDLNSRKSGHRNR